MSDNVDVPKFGPTDLEGFRTASFFGPAGEMFRVSVRMEGLTMLRFGGIDYLPEQEERLRAAAAIMAARGGDAPEKVLADLIDQVNEHLVPQIETHFPLLAWLGLMVANEVCDNLALNALLRDVGVSPVSVRLMIEPLLNFLGNESKRLIAIRVGRPLETLEHIQEVCTALRRLDEREQLHTAGKRPTQRQIVDELNHEDPEVRTTRRTLRRWANGCGLTWDEFLCMCLRMCGWRIRSGDKKLGSKM